MNEADARQQLYGSSGPKAVPTIQTATVPAATGGGWTGTIGGTRMTIGGLPSNATQAQALDYLRNDPRTTASVAQGFASPSYFKELYPDEDQAAYGKVYKTRQKAIKAGTGNVADSLAKAAKFEFTRATNLVKNVAHNPGQLLTGGIDPIGTKIGNAITGSNNQALVGQLGGATAKDFADYEAKNGVGSLGGARGMSQAADYIAGMFGAAGAANGLGNLLPSGASQAVSQASGSGAAQGGASALGSAADAALPEIVVTGQAAANPALGALASIGSAASGAGSAAGGNGADGAMPEITVTGQVAGNSGAGALGAVGGVGAATGATGAPNSSTQQPASNDKPEGNSILDRLFGGGGAGTLGKAGDWLSTLTSLYGAYNSAQGASDARDDLKNAMKNATTTLGGGTFTGAGGSTGTLGEDGKSGGYNLGDMEQLRGLLASLGNSAGANAQTGGLPQNIQDALTGVQGASGLPGLPDTNGLSNNVNGTLAQSMADMNGGIKGVQDNYLKNLRADAQPFEDRAYDKLQNDLFSTGRSGSSGGALQTEAFARGLGQADTQRQIAATDMGRNLLQDAFGRFSTTTGLASDLTQQRFGNATLQNQTGYDRANTNLGNQINAAQLPAGLQGQQLQLALQALGGQTQLQDNGLAQFQAMLAASQSAANARIGSGSTAAQLAGMRSSLPSSNDIWGQVLTGIGQRTGNQTGAGSIGSILGGLFGNKTTQPVYNGNIGGN